MIIVTDFDNCINNLINKTLELYNLRTGKNIQLDNITCYELADCLPLEDANGIKALFKEEELWKTLAPIPGSRAVLKQLIKKGHNVYIATATDVVNFKWKCEWLSTFYPFISTDNVIRIIDKSMLKCDVLIEDNLDNLIGNCCERICIDYPWNRSSSKDYAYDIYRAYEWDDVLEFINDIERKMKEWEKM